MHFSTKIGLLCIYVFDVCYVIEREKGKRFISRARSRERERERERERTDYWIKKIDAINFGNC